VRKELAWLTRGPLARTTKSKFRVREADALIADEPEARDRAELLRFATQRLGKKAVEALEVSLELDGRAVLSSVTWRLGPGDRVALVGVNGSGKTSLVKLLAGELAPSGGVVERGETVRLAHLSQGTVELPESPSVLESLEEARELAVLSDGREITASLLCDRFGFRGEKARALVRDLSGGERRRLALMRLLMSGPNVLLLDEPTNDLDVDTLTALEDLLDGWPGTLVVVSHDRYFVERVCDDVYAIDPASGVRHLPAGIDQYLEERSRADGATRAGVRARVAPSQRTPTPGAAARAARKDTQRSARAAKRLEREIERISERERSVREEMAANPTDSGRLETLLDELERLIAEREELEASWLETAESLEG
jgi:ATP-binding cassette subfamily F protein uup